MQKSVREGEGLPGGGVLGPEKEAGLGGRGPRCEVATEAGMARTVVCLEPSVRKTKEVFIKSTRKI